MIEGPTISEDGLVLEGDGGDEGDPLDRRKSLYIVDLCEICHSKTKRRGESERAD